MPDAAVLPDVAIIQVRYDHLFFTWGRFIFLLVALQIFWEVLLTFGF